MARIAFILLCHRDVPGIVRQARALTAAGDCVSIHFDARAGQSAYADLRAALRDDPGVIFADRRHACGWGEWSLVAATLEALRAAIAGFPDATHFYMLSGDCAPIKSARHAHAMLEAESLDYIESFDFHTSGWIKTGIREERLIYRHWFNERSHKRLFYAAMELQRRLGLRRSPPADLRVMIGSQWWCLRRATVEAIVAFIDRRPDVVRFFRTTWIPDETFFQTLVPHLVPDREIRRRTLTFLVFTDYGMPVTFHADHEPLLLSQDYLFARKISPDAGSLKSRLAALWSEADRRFAITGDGRAVYRYLAGQGRVGLRNGVRFWERGASLGVDTTLYVVACAKWHVGQRIAARMSETMGIPFVGYLFNDPGAVMPDLGGIGSSLEKRSRHRRAVVRMVLEAHGRDRLILCIDPASLDLIRDFAADRCQIRVLQVDCVLDDAFLRAHAERIGVLSPASPEAVAGPVMAAVRADQMNAATALREARLPGYQRIREHRSADENAQSLGWYLDIPADRARAILGGPELYED